MILQARDIRFTFPRPSLMMGVVNVTPDSFSDGGRFFDADAAIEQGLKLAAEGADILDVGGESTRPNAEPVSEKEELRRIRPVVEALVRSGKPVSIDTYKVPVAREALRLGASIVNDIQGDRADPEMSRLVAEYGAGYVIMHVKGTPLTMQQEASYENLLGEVTSFFAARLRLASQCGVRLEQTILDPGIGFAKTAEHNLQLLAELKRFTIHQRPLLIGASRKSFIARHLGGQDRLPGSLACAAWAVMNGAQIVRTHDVDTTRQTVRMIEEIRSKQDSQR